MYLYVRRAIKETVVIIEAKFANFVQNFIHHSAIMLIPYTEKIIGEHQCVLRRNRSTTDYIFCIRQMFEKKGD